MEEVEQPRNDELAKEANAKGAKDRGAGGATGEAEGEGGGRSNLTGTIVRTGTKKIA